METQQHLQLKYQKCSPLPVQWIKVLHELRSPGALSYTYLQASPTAEAEGFLSVSGEASRKLL